MVMSLQIPDQLYMEFQKRVRCTMSSKFKSTLSKGIASFFWGGDSSASIDFYSMDREAGCVL